MHRAGPRAAKTAGEGLDKLGEARRSSEKLGKARRSFDCLARSPTRVCAPSIPFRVLRGRARSFPPAPWLAAFGAPASKDRASGIQTVDALLCSQGRFHPSSSPHLAFRIQACRNRHLSETVQLSEPRRAHLDHRLLYLLRRLGRLLRLHRLGISERPLTACAACSSNNAVREQEASLNAHTAVLSEG
eukprot:6204009-Pleurochrysis_carterae.AAC.2